MREVKGMRYERIKSVEIDWKAKVQRHLTNKYEH